MRASRTERDGGRGSGPIRPRRVTPSPSGRHSCPVSLACSDRAEASVREAIWSTITRLRARSSGASWNRARNCGSRPSGARAVSASASSATTIRWSARSRSCSARCMTYRSATALRTAHSRRAARGTTSSAVVPREPARAVRRARGGLRGEAEPADELAGGVLQPGLRDGRAVVAVRPPLLGQEAVEGFAELGGVGVRRDVPPDGDREDLLPLGLRVQAVGVDVARVEAVLDVVHGVRHVVGPVHDLGLEGGAGAGGALADPVEDGAVVVVDPELRGLRGRSGGRRAARGTWWRRPGRRG